MASYSFARFRFRGSDILFYLILSGMMIPAFITIIPLFRLYLLVDLVNTYLGIILIYTSISIPFSVFILRGFFERIPTDFYKAAKIDGCSEWQAFWRVMLPIAFPAISTVAIFNFVGLWNDFLYALIFLQKDALRTLPLGIMMYQGVYSSDWGALAAILVISAIPSLIFYAIFQEQVVKGITGGVLKG